MFFSPEYVYHVLNIQTLMVWIATISIIAGSLFAIFHSSFLKTVTFIVVAEIGYIVGGLWIGHPDAIIGSIFHIVADSLMTLSLFMIAGIVLFLLKSDKLSNFNHVFKNLPYTTVGLIVVFASIIGVPPTSGFFSKFYLIKGAFQMGHYMFIVALLVASLTALFLFFRLFETSFYNNDSSETQLPVKKEPVLLVLPLLVTSGLIIALGLTFSFWLQFIMNIIPVGLR